MKKAKFLQLFNTLNASEIKAFEKHLKKNFATGSQVFQVFKYLKKYKTDEKKLEKEYALKKIFKQEKVTKSSLTNLLSDLFLALEEFLLWQQFKKKKDDFDIVKIRLDIWKERKLDAWFDREITKQKEYIAQQPKDIWYHYKLMYLSHLSYFSANTDTTAVSFNTNLNHLEDFFIAARLKYHLIEKNRQNIFDEPLRDYLSIDMIRSTDKLANLKEDIFISTYLKIIDLLKHSKEEDFYFLKRQLTKSNINLVSKDLLIVLTILFNFATIQIREGKERFIEEKIELYQYGLDSGVLLVDNYLDGNQFINMINLACTVEKMSLAEALKNNSLHQTNPKEQLAIEGIANAIINFHKEDYSMVLENLRTIKFHNEYFAIRSKSLVMLSMMMTQKNHQVVLDFCKAFDNWLRRENTLSSVVNLGAKNAIHLVRLFYQKKDLNFIDWFTIIQKTRPLFHVYWFKNQFLEWLKSGSKL